MRPLQHHQQRIGLLFLLVAASQVGFSQTIDQSSFSKLERQRLGVIASEWGQCDKISAEGLRLECTKRALAAFESEILRANAEVRKSLPAAHRKQFDSLCQSWKRYFDAEKEHWLQMSGHVGTVRWIGSHNALVQIAQSRLEFLLGELP